jgi:hypothetical protein
MGRRCKAKPSSIRLSPRSASRSCGNAPRWSLSYEIRLILGANGKYALLQVPADKFSTKKAEDARQSLLKLIGLAEGGCTIGEKVPGGNWGATPALCAFPDTWPAQSLVELAASTYDPDMVTNMNNPILQRFRKQT